MRLALSDFKLNLSTDISAPASLKDLSFSLDGLLDFLGKVPFGLENFGNLLEASFDQLNIPGLDLNVDMSLINISGGPVVVFDLAFNLQDLKTIADLTQIDIGSTSVLKLKGAGGVTFDVDGTVEARFGWDFKTMKPYFDADNTLIQLDVSADDGDGLVLGANLGALASVSVGSLEPGQEKGTISLTDAEGSTAAAHIELHGNGALTGSAFFQADLPIYATPGGHLGDITVEASLALDPAKFSVNTDFVGVGGSSLNDVLSTANLGLKSWLDGAITFIDGLIVTVESDALEGLPLLGEIKLPEAGFLHQLRDVFVTLGNYDTPQELLDNLTNYIQAALPLSLAPVISFSLDGLEFNDHSPDWGKSFNELLKSNDSLLVNLQLTGRDFTTLDASSLDLDLDSLGLNFNTEGGVDLALDYGLNLGLGYSRSKGFYLQGSDGDEIALQVGVGFSPGSQVEMSLGALKFGIEDGTPGSIIAGAGVSDAEAKTHRELDAGLKIDLGSGVIGDSGAGFFADTSIKGSLKANLDVDLTADLFSTAGLGVSLQMGYYGTGGAPVTFAYDVGAGSYAPGAGEFHFGFSDAYITLGDLIGAPVLDLLRKAQQAFEPLDPVIDILKGELPLLTDLSKAVGGRPITTLDFIRAFGNGGDSAYKFISMLANIKDIVGGFDTGLAGDLKFDLGSLQPKNAESLLDGGQSSKDDFVAPIDNNPDDIASIDGETGSLLSSLEDIGLAFPILENPSSNLYNLLLGGDADIITWDIPDLHTSTGFRQISPTPIPFLFAVVFGDLGFDTNFDLGYDTRGIRQWLDSDHNNTGLLLNGIYLADSHANGVDAELSAYARIGVGAEFNIAVASAGVEGGLRGVLEADLKDPNHDGKIHYDEFLANASRGLEYTFDLRGLLQLYLEAYLKLGTSWFSVSEQHWGLAQITLIDWRWGNGPQDGYSLAHVDKSDDGDSATQDGKSLILHVGSLAYLAGSGYVDGDESMLIDVAREADGTPITGSLTVSAYGYSQTFSAAELSGVKFIRFDAGKGNDTVIATSQVRLDMIGYGGAGNDSILGGAGNNEVMGDAGSDLLAGRSGNDSITGGDGSDRIYGYSGADSLDGGSGDDLLYGNTPAVSGPQEDEIVQSDQSNQIKGGSGNDIIFGGEADDLIYAGSGPDRVYGGLGHDSIYGEGGNDTLYGYSGDDEVSGSDSANYLDAGADNDLVFGHAGADTLFGGGGNDSLYGAGGNDSLSANSGDDYLQGDDGDDTLQGAGGNDTLRGDAGNDRLEGGANDDYLLSGDGNDLALGNDGNDTIHGHAGNDKLQGGSGNDQLLAGEGQDTVEGNDGNDLLIAVNVNGHKYDQTPNPLNSGVQSFDGGAGLDRLVIDDDVSVTLTQTGFSLSTSSIQHHIVSIEEAELSGGNSNTIFDASAYAGYTWMFGKGGDDTFIGSSGVDVMSGGTGNNIYLGRNGNDIVVVDPGSEDNLVTELSSEGIDLIDLTAIEMPLTVGVGSKTIPSFIDASNHYVLYLSAEKGMVEKVRLGAGEDTVEIAYGISSGIALDGHAGIDTLDYSGQSNGDPWLSKVNVNLLDKTATAFDRVEMIENLVGGFIGDSLVGENGTNVIQGNAGDDYLHGQGGNDRLYGGLGLDTLLGGDGDDQLEGKRWK
jgi:Ca2+-binding RTX toxin-like protein